MPIATRRVECGQRSERTALSIRLEYFFSAIFERELPFYLPPEEAS
jgi:hypothetical protein